MKSVGCCYRIPLYSLAAAAFIQKTRLEQNIIKAISPDEIIGAGPLENNARAWKYAIDIGNILLWIVIGISFIVIVYAGYMYTTSEGEVQKVERAKKAIIGAGIGIGIAMFSLTIVNLFAEFIGG